jgi:ABC-type uncharacterized transport system substrate-binding protein
MRRREFIAALGGAAAWPLRVRAQQKPVPTIGYLSRVSNTEASNGYLRSLRRGLSEAGFIDGQNVRILVRWVPEFGETPSAVADLIQQNITATFGTIDVAVALKATQSTVPCVFVTADDPVAAGVAASFNRPGGNVTGVRLRAGDEPTKQLELLHELVPSATKVGLLINPANQLGVDDVAIVEAAAHPLRVEIVVARASTETEFEGVIAGLAQAGVQALLIDEHLYFFIRRNQLIALSMQHKIPLVSSARGWALAGSLAAYGADENEAIRQAGIYLGRVLNGEKAGDLPILQPTKLSLILNLKTANALGLDIPPSLLARADEVIE